MSNDPTTLAREVLDAHERHLRDDTHHGVTFPMDRDALNLHINAAPTLARAVVAVAALAEKHEGTARDMGPGSYGGAIAAKIAQDIRDALNGGDA